MRRRAGTCSPRRHQRASTSKRRCSTAPARPWSWRDDGLELAGGGVSQRAGAAGGRGPRPDRPLGRGLPDRARRRHRRRPCGPSPPRGGAAGRQRRPGAGDAAGRDLPGREPSVRRRRLRPRRLADRAAPLRRHLSRGRRDGPRLERSRPRRGHALRRREDRGGGEAPRPDARALLLGGRVANDARGRAGRGLREATSARAVARPLRDAGGGSPAREGAAHGADRGRRVRGREARPQGEEALAMAIIVDRHTRLVVQGLTGAEGSFHGLRNKRYGTQVVAGVTPGKAGQDVEGIPVFNTVADAVAETGANTTMVFVPARLAADAIYEAVDAGIETVICIAEGLPAHEMLEIYTYIRPKGVTMLGPNCPGALSPGKSNVGIIPAEIFAEGNIGLVSRSGTLTYQIGHELTQMGLGNSTIVGIGGDPIVGSSFIDVLEKFQADPQTEYVVMVGEIGGDEEEKAAAFIEERMTKPVVAYIAGFTAPPGKTMGHAGAIISGSSGTAQGKKDALEAKGIRVGTSPTEAAELVAEIARG